MTPTTSIAPPRLARASKLRLGVLDRYLVRQFLTSYALCSTVIIGLFVVLEGLSHLDNFLQQERSLLVVLFYYFCATVPVYFSQILGPVLTLIGALFSITLLNKGNEIVPMRATGMSMSRILAPFLVTAGFFGVLMIVVQETIIPRFKEEIRLANSYSSRNRAIKPDMVVDATGALIKVGSYDPHEKIGQYIEVKSRHPDGKVSRLLRAAEVRWIGNDDTGHWKLHDVDVQEWDANGEQVALNPTIDGPERIRLRPESMELTTDMKPVDLESTDKDIPFLTWQELRLQYKRRPHLTHLEVKIHRRLAFPLANVILLLLGFPLVLRGFSRSLVVGVAAAIVIAAAYLLVDTLCSGLGNQGRIPPILAAWLPVLFFGALGYTMFVNIEN
ncbi:MAG: LptF/LptG family permease [Planctomycetota bacterium]